MVVDCWIVCIVSCHPVCVQLWLESSAPKQFCISNPPKWMDFESKVRESFSSSLNDATEQQFSLYFIADLSNPLESRADVRSQEELEQYLHWRTERSSDTQLFLQVSDAFQSGQRKPTSPMRPPPIITKFSNNSPVIKSPSRVPTPSPKMTNSPKITSPSSRSSTPIQTPSSKTTNSVMPYYTVKHILLPPNLKPLQLSNDAGAVDTNTTMFRLWNGEDDFFPELSTNLTIQTDDHHYIFVLAPRVYWTGIPFYSSESAVRENYECNSQLFSASTTDILNSCPDLQLLQDPTSPFHFGLCPLQDMAISVFEQNLVVIAQLFRPVLSAAVSPTSRNSSP